MDMIVCSCLGVKIFRDIIIFRAFECNTHEFDNVLDAVSKSLLKLIGNNFNYMTLYSFHKLVNFKQGRIQRGGGGKMPWPPPPNRWIIMLHNLFK